ncbi:MAG TPA: O-antigen ligase family protein [Candidatus Binatia bacterium]|jgi:O-antigen ligase
MIRRDRRVLVTLQALLLTLPLFLGGRHPVAVLAAGIAVTVLLAVTAQARRDTPDAPYAPGVAALAAFVLVALATTLPLPPRLLAILDPSLARLTATLLPGWPAAAEWTAWRPLAMDPYGVIAELTRVAIGLGAFTVIVAYPWRSEEWGADARAQVFGRLLLTAIAGGVLLGAIALLEQIAGNGHVLWIGPEAAEDGRASGSFVNPNHLAAWLELVFPVALTYAVALAVRLRRRLARAVHAGRGMGVHARRAWISAIIAQQQRLWPPLAAAGAAALILVAHLATGSRGGTAALLAGVVVAIGGATSAARPDARGRWIPLVAVLAIVTVGLGGVALKSATDDDSVTLEGADVDFASRLAVSVAGTGIVRDYPVFGTGLGSWLHAFRPYQAPPVPGGIWDHAHDDYLELVAETGLIGVGLAALFALAVARAARREEPGPPAGADANAVATASPAGLPAERERRSRSERGGGPPGFETSEWWAALSERTLLRFGLAGGVIAILVHSLVDFGLRLPANLLLTMTILALLVVSGRRQPVAPSRGVLAIAVTLVFILAVQFANIGLRIAAARPLAPPDCLDRADLRLAENGDAGRDEALALVHRSLDRNPFDREAHEALANVLDEGPDAEAALARALVLDPWSASVRDRLGMALWTRGERVAGATELEDSMRRMPALASHAYLSPDTTLATQDPTQLLRSLTEGDTVRLRLAGLSPDLAAAVERGLRRGLDEAEVGPDRAAVVDDLTTLLEVGERWQEAATLLHDEANRSASSGDYLARAARDYLKAKAGGPAEQTLLAALVGDPDQGDLYRKLAVDVYAARGDFANADTVLQAAQQNAVDLLSVYRGVNEVLSRRAASDDDHAAMLWAVERAGDPEDQ